VGRGKGVPGVEPTETMSGKSHPVLLVFSLSFGVGPPVREPASPPATLRQGERESGAIW
jgi:hypothetical protein